MAGLALDITVCPARAGARSDLGDRTVLEGVPCDVLCRDTVARYRKEFSLTTPDHPWSGLSDEDFLLRIGATGACPDNGERHPTQAGLLMFGDGYAIADRFPTYLLDYRKEIDDFNRSRIVSNSGLWSGNVFDFWSAVSEEIVTGPGLTPKKRDDGGEDEADESPTPLQQSVCEALANALVNADYEGESPVCVVRECKWLTFVNPVRPDRVRDPGLDQDAASDEMRGMRVPHPFNPTIATMFNLVGVGERCAGGIPLIERGCDKAGIPRPSLVYRSDPPRAEFSFDLTRIVGGILFKVTTIESVGRRKARRISNRENVMNYVDQHGYITRLDVEEILDLGRSASANLLAAMVRENSLKIDGSGPTTRYLAAGQGRPEREREGFREQENREQERQTWQCDLTDLPVADDVPVADK